MQQLVCKIVVIDAFHQQKNEMEVTLVGQWKQIWFGRDSESCLDAGPLKIKTKEC